MVIGSPKTKKMKILSLTYLGNIQYFSKLIQGDCIIDPCENYVKQSFRNRCEIMTADGVKSLSIQTVKGSNANKSSLMDTEIDYSKRWQSQHWKAISSSYKSSPYFDYYVDALEPIYKERYDTLYQFNSVLLECVLRLIGSDVKPVYSESYVDAAEFDEDWRGGISPKVKDVKPDVDFKAVEYWQVFSERHPFAPNLSILDLLFCEGPNALQIIKDSTVIISK